jgi:pyruvate dehydrogenase E1 component alpha subunit
MPGVLVDGNDVLAVYKVTQEARRRALAGQGPSLIEAVTTRLGPHTTSDDPSRYTDAAQREAERQLDPIARFKHWLSATGRWDDEDEVLADKWCEAAVRQAVDEFESVPVPNPSTMFNNLYADDAAGPRCQPAPLTQGASR